MLLGGDSVSAGGRAETGGGGFRRFGQASNGLDASRSPRLGCVDTTEFLCGAVVLVRHTTFRVFDTRTEAGVIHVHKTASACFWVIWQ